MQAAAPLARGLAGDLTPEDGLGVELLLRGETQNFLPASQLPPVYPSFPPPPCDDAKARCKYVSGLGAHLGHDRSRGVYFASHTGHVLRYASDHGT